MSSGLNSRIMVRALKRLKVFLESRSATVRVVYLPSDDGSKVGVDDYLVSGKTINDLVALASEELKPPPHQEEESSCSYRATKQGLVWLKPTHDGIPVPVALTNFGARITADIAADDGVETQRGFEIAAQLGEQSSTFIGH